MMPDRSPVEQLVTVRFRDLDALGHVNYAVYLTYFEDCLNQLWEEVLVSAGRTFDPTAPGIVTVHVEVDYRASATWNQELQIETWVSKIGHTSFASDYRIIDMRCDKKLIASARTIQVVTIGLEKSSGMPEAIRSGLQQFVLEPSSS